jgi:polysaccharide deacetylase family protein (PEP-CTERM system associated)
MKTIFSVDVEDWFHILGVPSTPPIEQWDGLPSTVEHNFRRLLDIFDEKGARVTCFFLGWVAQRFPHLVREASDRGHEIASHGFVHRLVYEQTADEFYEDALTARRILEDISGRPVIGYRSSGFSVTLDTPWFFDKLLEAGYRYDSSVFPAPRGHGGMASRLDPHVRRGELGDLMEFPITVVDVLGRKLCFFGGGYLRLFPWTVIRRMTRRVLDEGRPVVFYIHPREIDPNHPRLRMSARRRFKSYVNLATTETKLRHILDEFDVTSFDRFIAENPAMFATEA